MSGRHTSEVSGRWSNDEAAHLHGDLGGQDIDRRTQGPHRQAVAGPATAAARAQQTGKTADMDTAPTAERHPLAHSDRCALARRARTLRPLAIGLPSAAVLAADRHLGTDRAETARHR